MYCKHTLLGTNISPPKAIWRWLSFYQGGICLFPGGYCILVIIIFQDFRPILPFTQEIADTFSPEKLTMELLTGTSFSSFFCAPKQKQSKYIMRSSPMVSYHFIGCVIQLDVIQLDIIQFQSSIITCHCAQSTLKKSSAKSDDSIPKITSEMSLLWRSKLWVHLQQVDFLR